MFLEANNWSGIVLSKLGGLEDVIINDYRNCRLADEFDCRDSLTVSPIPPLQVHRRISVTNQDVSPMCRMSIWSNHFQ